MNVSFIAEFLVLVNGPLMQCITYFILTMFCQYERSIELLKSIHYTLLIFNLLPIYPLDGGKLLNLVMSLFFSYRTSLDYSIKLSYFIIFIFSLFLPLYFKINYIFILVFLLYKVTEEKNRLKYYVDKFLLERYLYSYSFNKVCIVKSIKDFRRGYRHIINNNKGVFSEKEILTKKFYKS